MPAGAPGVSVGDRVRVKAQLHPPPRPPLPGAFDFPRHAYFERLGAVGYAFGHPTRLAAESSGPSLVTRIGALRAAVVTRVRALEPGPAGAVAAALMTGERGPIPDPVEQALRDAGLAHLLAISGLHVGLIAGAVFFVVRVAGAAIPFVALRWPVKAWAAGAALTAAAAYLVLTGFTVPTVRAFVMTGLVLLAVTFNRRAITMRLVAVAATGMLLVRPESLVGVSFQLSFAATAALVAVYEGLRQRRGRSHGRTDISRRIASYIGGVVLTTLVATVATAPFTVLHFNRLAIYGVVANIAAVPLAAFWIMPLALAVFVTLPLGLAAWPLAGMTWGIDAVITVAHAVAAWPHAVVRLPTPPAWGVGMVVLGGLWLVLWSARWRWLGAAPVVAGALSVAAPTPPAIIVDGEARLMAVRGPDGRLYLSRNADAGYTRDVWLSHHGQRGAPAFPPPGEATATGRLRCDPYGCVYRGGGETVALNRYGRALSHDCRRATVLVSTEPVQRETCPGPARIVGRFDLWRAGTHTIRVAGPGVTIATVRDARGDRPWVRQRGE